MRIAIVNWTSRPVGGVGSYLRMVIPALARRGHDLALWHESGSPPDGDPFALPTGSLSWSVEQIGLSRALAELDAWKPDVFVCHGLIDPAVEAATLEIAPGVFQVHGYQGTCISGAKTFKYPTPTPCSRRFGWPCLVNYYPRHCGGWSPITMVREFHRGARHLELLSGYKALLVYSPHMQREFARHGLEATCIEPPGESAAELERIDRGTDRSCRLLFVGRMDRLKGGGYLLDALPLVVAALDRPVEVILAGDGPERKSWQAAAEKLAGCERRVGIAFTGWLDRVRIDELMRRADLLVVPSVWPEPFGLVGLEAARAALPVAAFAVGGIPDWLRPGVNGQLAPGDPPTVKGLAEAIVACVKNDDTHARLCAGAGRIAAEFDLDVHLDKLTRVLHDTACRRHQRLRPGISQPLHSIYCR